MTVPVSVPDALIDAIFARMESIPGASNPHRIPFTHNGKQVTTTAFIASSSAQTRAAVADLIAHWVKTDEVLSAPVSR